MIYKAYFYGRKIVDAISDYAQGGFTKNRFRQVFNNELGLKKR